MVPEMCKKRTDYIIYEPFITISANYIFDEIFRELPPLKLRKKRKVPPQIF